LSPKSRALTEGDYGLKDIADLLLRKGTSQMLKIKTNAHDRGDQKGHQLQIIPYISR